MRILEKNGQKEQKKQSNETYKFIQPNMYILKRLEEIDNRE